MRYVHRHGDWAGARQQVPLQLLVLFPPMAAPGGCQVLTCFVHGFCHASILTTLSMLVYFVLFGIVLFSSYSCHAERYCKGCETRSKRPGVWTWSIWSQRLQSAMIGDVCSRCCHDLALFCPRVAFFGLLWRVQVRASWIVCLAALAWH